MKHCLRQTVFFPGVLVFFKKSELPHFSKGHGMRMFLAHPPLRLAEFIHCSFTHSLTQQALVTLSAELSAQHWGGRGQRRNPGAEGAHAVMRQTVSWWLPTDVLFSNI